MTFICMFMSKFHIGFTAMFIIFLYEGFRKVTGGISCIIPNMGMVMTRLK